MAESKLNAKNLKSALWETLNQVKEGKMDAGQADSIATQAREITRVVKTQIQIAKQSKRAIPLDVIDFSEK